MFKIIKVIYCDTVVYRPTKIQIGSLLKIDLKKYLKIFRYRYLLLLNLAR